MPTPTAHVVQNGSMIGSSLEFFTLTVTGVNLTTNQAVLNSIIETISMTAQPVILDIEDATTLKFAVEHAMSLVEATMVTAVTAAILFTTTAAVPSAPVTSTVTVTKATRL